MKRTALGRVKHESAYVHVTKGGRVVVYTGDDQVNEHVYKFVSDDNWQSARARGRSPLDDGTLYVRSSTTTAPASGSPWSTASPGLTAANGFADQGDVLVKTRFGRQHRRGHPDGPPRVGLGRPAHRHGVPDPDQQHEPREGR